MVDLEAQLAHDEGQDDAALRARDRGLYLSLAPAPVGAEALLVAWLEGLRARFGAPQLGERVASAHRLLRYALAALGLLTGWGTAEALLHFEQGGAPVNVGHFLLVLVLGQIAALLLLLASVLLRRLFPELPMVGDVGRLLRFFVQRLAQSLGGSPQSLASAQLGLQRLRARLGLYRELERYLLLSEMQLFALLFNIGALASCLRLIVLSDLAFAWSTSVATLDAAQVQKLCSWLSAPFAWLVPEAVPSPELIEHTQYFRLEGRFADAAPGTRGDPALAGQWWLFLVACTVTYGLLPRLLTLGFFRYRLRRAQAEVPLDTPLVERVLTRMTTPELSTRPRELVTQHAEPSRTVVAAHELTQAQTTSVVLYRDVPTNPALVAAELTRQLGLTVTHVVRAGGYDAQAEATLCAELARARSSVCLVTEAWEAPDKGLRGFLSALRQALGARVSLRVVLIGEASATGFRAAEPEDVKLFRDRLTLLADPYLTVEPLTAAQEAEREHGVQELGP